MHTDADLEVREAFRGLQRFAFGDEVAHLQRGVDHIGGVRGVGRGQATSGHVGIADGLDLLDAVLRHDVVESTEALVDVAHEFFRCELFAHGGEALEVGEQDGDLIDVYRLCGAFLFQFFRHFLGQDVQEQFITAPAGLRDLVALSPHHAQEEHREGKSTANGVAHHPCALVLLLLLDLGECLLLVELILHLFAGDLLFRFLALDSVTQ